MEVRWQDSPPLHFPTCRARSVFAFLALNPLRTFHRDVLAGQFWGERTDAKARKALRTTLWRIRSVLKPRGDEVSILRVSNEEIGFLDSDATWVDALEFQRRVHALAPGSGSLLDEEATSSLDRAVDLYRGDLLDGLYDDWCVVERERFRLSYLGALERLMGHHEARGEWRAALAFGRKVLQADPLREDVHRRVMVCHQAMGNRPSAIRQFRRCQAVLREELELEPMEETVRLCERIKAGEPPPDERSGQPAPAPGATRRRGRTGKGPTSSRSASMIDRLSAATARLERTVDRLNAPADE